MNHFYLLTLGCLLLVGPALAQTPATFAPAVTYGTGTTNEPYGLAVADVNGDGKLDVLTANYNSSTASVLLGTGTGTFGAAATYSTGPNSTPAGIAVADVNGDGKPDLLTANQGSSTVGVLLGTGTGTFGAAATYSMGTGSQPISLAVADVNGDGKLDVLTANYGGNTAGVLLGTGTGSFGTAATFSTGFGSTPYSIAVADVSGDGKLDVLTANISSDNVAVLLGTGTGSFGSVALYNTGNNSGPRSLAVADVNGDGRPDALVANNATTISGNGAAGVLLGTGTGSFGPIATYPSGAVTYPRGIAVADVNGDGKPDLALANSNTVQAGVLLGTGTGTFGAITTYYTGFGSTPFAIAAADVNGDGKPDLLTANSYGSTISVLLNTTPSPVLVPTLTALSSTSGPVGTVVTLTGTNLTGLTGVSFNGVAAATFAATSATTATATVPASATTGPVTLTTAAGTATGPAFTVTPLLTVPNVDTSIPPTVLSTSATLGGIVNSDGGSPVTERGIVYSPGATPPPTIANLKVPMGAGLGSFAGTIGGLLPNRTYTARAYATNAVGTGYGVLAITFVTLQGLASAAPQAAGVALFPNPAHLAATLTATSLPAATAQLAAVLLNPLGQEVCRLVVPATGGAATAAVPTAGLAAGLYVLRLDAVNAQGAGLGTLPTQRLAVE